MQTAPLQATVDCLVCICFVSKSSSCNDFCSHPPLLCASPYQTSLCALGRSMRYNQFRAPWTRRSKHFPRLIEHRTNPRQWFATLKIFDQWVQSRNRRWQPVSCVRTAIHNEAVCTTGTVLTFADFSFEWANEAVQINHVLIRWHN